MKTDYTALDAAILAHIRSGSPVYPMYAGACLEPARLASASDPFRTIDRRLQALRKAGTIQHDRGAPAGGWIIVEPSTDC